MGCNQSQLLPLASSPSALRTIDQQRGIRKEPITADISPCKLVVQSDSIGTTSTDSTETSFCWICHDEGHGEDGQPLISGCCSCRGSCHLSCVVRHAESRTKVALDRGHVNLHDKWYVHAHLAIFGSDIVI
jgi:hypothetical protein